MKTKISLLAGLIAVSPMAVSLNAQTEVTTDPVGYVSVEFVAASDTRISVPLHRAPEQQGEVDGVSDQTIAIAGDPGLGDFDSHFIVVKNGDAVGLRATIIDNDDSSVTVEDVDLSNLAAGDSIQIVPHWTLGTLFPEDMADGTEVLVFDVAAGINRAPSNSYVFNNGTWREGLADVSDTVILQGESFIVRDDFGDNVTFVVTGHVPMATTQQVHLSTVQSNTDQDNFVGLTIPIPITLGDSGLGLADGFEILIPDNESSGINKAPGASFVFSNGSWREGLANRDDFELQPGVGYIVRIPGQEDPTDYSWEIQPGYAQ